MNSNCCIYDAGNYSYAIIVFKGIYFLPNIEETSTNNYEKNHPTQIIHVGTGNTYTSVVIYKCFCSGDILKKQI